MSNQKEISDSTKAKVLKRQHNRSIGGDYLTDVEFHHFKTRNAGGVGYEWNIVALTTHIHRQWHEGCQTITMRSGKKYSRKEFESLMRNHLVLNYRGWSEDKLKCIKYGKESDYGITRLYDSGCPIKEGFKRQKRTDE